MSDDVDNRDECHYEANFPMYASERRMTSVYNPYDSRRDTADNRQEKRPPQNPRCPVSVSGKTREPISGLVVEIDMVD